MAVIQPFNNRYELYLNGQNGSASFSGLWMDLRKSKVIFANVSWTAIASTAGTLAIQGTEDSQLAATSIVTLTPTVVHGAQPSGGTAGSLILVVADHPTYVRLTYTRSGGGGAGQFSAWIHGRSV